MTKAELIEQEFMHIYHVVCNTYREMCETATPRAEIYITPYPEDGARLEGYDGGKIRLGEIEDLDVVDIAASAISHEISAEEMIDRWVAVYQAHAAFTDIYTMWRSAVFEETRGYVFSRIAEIKKLYTQ